MIEHCLQELSEELTSSDILEYCKGIEPKSCLEDEIKLKYLNIKLVEIQLKMEDAVAGKLLDKNKKKLFKKDMKYKLIKCDKRKKLLMNQYYSTIYLFLSCSVYLLENRFDPQEINQMGTLTVAQVHESSIQSNTESQPKYEDISQASTYL